MHRLKIIIYIAILFIFLSVSANAEIEKIALLCEEGICFYWWPKLPSVKGWHHEREVSYEYRVNAQAPDGYTFANAETVIYANALYKPQRPEIKSLEMFINSDKQDFLSKDPDIIVSEVASLKTGDGQILKSLTFSPKKKGNWEQVSYGEEDEFYLIFTVSSRTKDGLTKALPAYKQFINNYKAKL